MKKFLTFAAMATLALSSCNNDNDDEQGPVTDGDVIRFGAEAISVTTKAPYEGTISGSNPLKARILGSSTQNNYGPGSIYTDNAGSRADGIITFTDNGQTSSSFDTGVKWPTSNTTSIYFRGFYPSEDIWTVEQNSATADIDGKTDLMTAPEITGTKASVEQTPLVFKFSHLLTKLHVKVQGNAVTADDWGNIKSIELSKALNAAPNNQLGYTYNGNQVTTSGTATTIPFYLVTEGKTITYTDVAYTNQDYLVPSQAELVAYSLVAPVEAVKGNGGVNDEYTLKITTTKGQATSGREVAINLKDVEGKDFVGSTAGKKFDILIQFLSNGQITASATVTDWVEGGTGTGQM